MAELTEHEEIDYRPLPPRRGIDAAPRPIETNDSAQSGRRGPARGWLNGWTLLVLAAAVILAGTAGLVWEGTRPAAGTAPEGMPLFASTILAEIPDAETREQILSLDAAAAQGQAAIAQNPRDPNAWAFLGNAHYDFIQTIYEAAPNGEAYAQNLSRWLEASEAYSQALALDPLQSIVRADRGLALIRYGLGFGNPGYVEEGLREAERALRDDDQTLQVLITVGRAYALATPPRDDDARRLWARAIELAPGSQQAAQAQRLIDGARP